MRNAREMVQGAVEAAVLLLALRELDSRAEIGDLDNRVLGEQQVAGREVHVDVPARGDVLHPSRSLVIGDV